MDYSPLLKSQLAKRKMIFRPFLPQFWSYYADFRGDERFCSPPSGGARVYGSGLGGYFEGVCGAPKSVYVAIYVIPPRNP